VKLPGQAGCFGFVFSVPLARASSSKPDDPAVFTEIAPSLSVPGLTLHDPLAAGVAVDASFVEWETMRLAIGDDGETRRTSGIPNCRVAMRVDRARFVATFLDRLCPAS
jgi:inosine-uridine nucleoside N-ribohydrolase